MSGKFACLIDCVDGRTTFAAIGYMMDRYKVDYVDQVTEPGPVRILADNTEEGVIENIRKRLRISVHNHGTKVVGIVAHPHCAGNPLDKETQLKQAQAAKRTVDSFEFEVTVILLWICDDWKTVEAINDAGVIVDSFAIA